MSALRLRLDVRIWQCMCILVFLMCILVLANDSFIDSKEPLVKTKWGLVRGKWSRTLWNRKAANFLGIPYALPPVGELRFKSPQRWNRTWTTIRDATVDGEKCIQYSAEIADVIGSEDCLYLNVFVPISDKRRQDTLPVLVFVHGGAFKTGSSDSKLLAPDYLMDQNIVLVTMNYRLSVLGFFSTTNQVSPGNYGIKDIKMALEWVQENIHNFYGNPKSVTLMGHSAGAAMTHILSLSKKTEGLFHKYILLSGSALNTWSSHFPEKYRQLNLEVAELVDCHLKKNDTIASNKTTTENPKEEDVRTNGDTSYPDYKVEDYEKIIKCMRMVDAKKIEVAQYFSVWRHPMCVFGPTLEDDSDDAILTMHPLKIIQNGLFRDIPAIFQVVKDEGLIKTLKIFTNPEYQDEWINNFEEYLPFFMEYNEVISNTSVFASAIQDFYFSGNVTLGLMHNITEMVSDGTLIWPIFQALQYQSKIGNSSIYFSFFAYRGTFSSTFSSGTQTYYGIKHGDDLNYFFPKLNNLYRNMSLYNTGNDITMINIITEMLANFMINGIPKAWMMPEWPNYRDHHEFMRFGIDKSPEIVVQTDFLPDRMEFWEKLVLNELTKLASDVNKPTKDTLTNDAIKRRLSIQFASLAIIYFYI